MDILSSLSQSLNQNLFPGRRVIRVKGYDAAEKYPMPRDCEAILLDEDPNSDYIYMKVTDVNGGEKFERYKIIADPLPKFEPDKYVTTDDFKSFKEEVLDAINSLKSPNGSADKSARSYGNNKQSGRSNNELSRSETVVQPNSQPD